MPPLRKLRIAFALAVPLWLGMAHAQFAAPDQGKLLATGGVIQVEGSGGGGLTPWALITGYGTGDSYGANIHATILSTNDYQLTTEGVAFGFRDRLELSFANQRFEGDSGGLNGVAIREQVFGLKVRVLGDAVYDQNTWVPQVALGVQYKDNQGITGLEGLGVHQVTDLGAKSTSGTDFYLSATKLYLAQSVLANITLRDTNANQFGLLGFGGPRNSSRSIEFEGSLAYLINRQLAVGIEYRDKPHNLAIDDERAAYDAFVAWFPTKNVSLTLAYVNLGTIVKPFVPSNQSGPYLSIQVGF